MEAIFANIQNGLIFGILGVFKSGFLHKKNYILCVGSFLIYFWQFYFLTQSDDFGKAIAFARRPFLPIFKMVSFLEY